MKIRQVGVLQPVVLVSISLAVYAGWSNKVFGINIATRSGMETGFISSHRKEEIMFHISDYHFTTVLSQEDIETLKEIYEDGKRSGYEDGYDNGEAVSEEYIKKHQREWIEFGRDKAVSDFIEKIGYSNLIRLQEKTQYQICFGGEVNVEEMIKAIKVLIEK